MNSRISTLKRSQMQKRSFLLSLIALIVVGCSSDDYTYSDHHCNLIINMSLHNDATLQSALNSMSPGIFCKITYDAASRSYVFTNNQGQSSRSGFNDIDRQSNNERRIGMNNGLIVGYGNLSVNDAGSYDFYAYDGQCPNCFDYNAIPMRSYPLTMTTAGMAVCNNCKRQYNMNSGGNCTNNTGKGLTRYRASTTGPLGMVYVY